MKPVRRTLGSEELRLVESDAYLGIGVSVTGATMMLMFDKVDEASATLETLRKKEALVRGMNLCVARQICKAFLL